MTDKQTKALYIARLLLQDGFTLAGAAGILGNIEAESGFDPQNLENAKEKIVGMTDAQYTAAVDGGYYTAFTTDQFGYGICQWTANDRKKGMLNFHRSRGKSIGDFNTQVDWMRQEIKSYLKAYTVCCQNTDPYTCGYVVCKHYEIPADTEAAAQYRGGLAQEWYVWLQANLEPVGQDINVPATPATDNNVGSKPEITPQADVVLLQTAMQLDGAWDKPIDVLNTAEWRQAFKPFAGIVLGVKIP